MNANPEELFGGTNALLSLIELIYGTVEDTGLWPLVLDRITDVLRGEEILIWTKFTAGSVANVMCSARMDARALQPYSEYYSSVNVLAERCDVMFADGRARFGDRAVPDREFEKTEFCNDYFHPHGMHYSVAIKMPIKGLSAAHLSTMRPKNKCAFEDREGTILETLAPHLQSALRLHIDFSHLRLRTNGLECGLDAFGHAIFGLNTEGRVIFSNRNADKIAQRADGIKVIGDRVVANRSNENQALQEQLKAASASGSRAGLSSGSSMLLHRNQGQPLRVTVMPWQGRLSGCFGELAALLFVVDPEDRTLSRAASLRALYGLTPAEARFAEMLANGKSVGEIADLSKTTLETARSHLKRTLAKTGARRQAELMRLIFSLPGQ